MFINGMPGDYDLTPIDDEDEDLGPTLPMSHPKTGTEDDTALVIRTLQAANQNLKEIIKQTEFPEDTSMKVKIFLEKSRPVISYLSNEYGSNGVFSSLVALIIPIDSNFLNLHGTIGQENDVTLLKIQLDKYLEENNLTNLKGQSTREL